MPLLVTRYGLRGALLLCGAIAMQAVPLVLLIRQPRLFKFALFILTRGSLASGSEKNKEQQIINAVAKTLAQEILLLSRYHHPASLN
ncbi:hypothetical protein HPB48_023110 [Haemaphysalis longicornis]|uniref:Uncharacterized protein n=1 Tax=Haemaphysalis longicornis TaxID=44386 RepID=A0A9J6GR56_HAELO|nr:hypothetical protein HPB48_023110 [Haemaphysalis longicornis]